MKQYTALLKLLSFVLLFASADVRAGEFLLANPPYEVELTPVTPNRVTVFDFSADWCGQSRQLLPSLRELADTHSQAMPRTLRRGPT
jgi:thiol-disulfide isomerase/thioredoxin